YKHSGLRTAACTAFQHAVSLDPGFTAARKFLGTVNISLGRLPEAENCFRQVLEDHPDDEEAISGLATALYRQKKTEQALTLLEPRLHKAIVSPAVALAYSRISRHTDKRAEVNRVLEAILDSGRSDLNSDSIAQIHFSLGQYHDMTGEYQQAFEHFRKGNNIRKPLEGSDAHPEPADKLIASFSRESLAAAERADSNTELPVFIVGMPRSGTSLVEQILASHPDIYGAGELDALPVLLDSIRPRAGTQSAFPESITRLERSRLTDISSRYISHLEQLDANALRITDKMPGNFLNLGYIELLFPKARVIHCKRNPLDTCLSCYFQDFDGHQYTSSLESLGNFYLQYERIMRHWNDVLNISIFEIQYENLVRNFEPACRALVEFCGVEWSDSCADFYNADRLVLTSSLDQVNRPLYNTSIERWKNYDSFIGSLKDILDSGTQSGRES
ncbi:MAG TPA: sulfotransferase, partial [Gammaproteobacteria bacterium]|nr:sulfotransferase [Gammaproteobacteria bacterium]